MSNEQSQHSGTGEKAQDEVGLSGPQRRFYEALADQDGDLAAMYEGAIQVKEIAYIADRFSMAAHNLRELLEKLPIYIGVGTNDSSEEATRREAFQNWVDGSDPSSTPIAEKTIDRLSGEWDSVREFFLAVCHHGKETDLEEFNDYLDRLENLILPRLRPSTFETQDILDQIIERGEANG
jgi:hypothetical protein